MANTTARGVAIVRQPGSRHGRVKGGDVMKFVKIFCFALIVVTQTGSAAYANEVVDWNQTLFRAGLVAGTNPLFMSRVAAIVQAAVFDAVNGIDRRYTPIHVPPAGPPEASREAAAMQALIQRLRRPMRPSITERRRRQAIAEPRPSSERGARLRGRETRAAPRTKSACASTSLRFTWMTSGRFTSDSPSRRFSSTR